MVVTSLPKLTSLNEEPINGELLEELAYGILQFTVNLPEQLLNA